MRKITTKDKEAYEHCGHFITTEKTELDRNGNSKGILSIYHISTGHYFHLASYSVFMNNLIPFDDAEKVAFFDKICKQAMEDYRK